MHAAQDLPPANSSSSGMPHGQDCLPYWLHSSVFTESFPYCLQERARAVSPTSPGTPTSPAMGLGLSLNRATIVKRFAPSSSALASPLTGGYSGSDASGETRVA